MRWSRRRFIGTLSTAALGAAVPPLERPVGALSAVICGADAGTGFGTGALLGIEEGIRALDLLASRRRLEMAPAPAPGESPSSLVERLIASGAAAAVLSLPAELHDPVEQGAAEAGLVVLDARARRPEGRAVPGVFRTGLWTAAYAAAVRSAGEPDGRAVLWDASLFRYGAEQLNERYRRRFEAPMTGEAWAAWMAVKAITEAMLRARGSGRAELLDRLAGPRAAFDGHKGEALAFSGPGGTLAQPLYVIGADGITTVPWPPGEPT